MNIHVLIVVPLLQIQWDMAKFILKFQPEHVDIVEILQHGFKHTIDGIAISAIDIPDLINFLLSYRYLNLKSKEILTRL